jgi:hypothetical protein
MAFSGAIYQRADIAILSALSVTTAQIGSYALALRGLDAVVAIRGSIVQTKATEWLREPRSAKSRIVRRLARELRTAAVVAGVAVIAGCYLLKRFAMLSKYPHLWDLCAIIGACLPLVAAHTLTSTWVYSRPGTVRSAGLSAALAALAVITTLALAAAAGISGAMWATCLLEYVSFLAFYLIQLRAARTFTLDPRLLISFIWLPGLFLVYQAVRHG